MRVIIILCLSLCVIAGSALAGETIPFADFEVGLSAGTIGNLLKDYQDISEKYTTPKLSVNLYPFSMLQVNILTEYTSYYDSLSIFSNLMYGAGYTLVPTGENSRLSVYLSGNAKKRKYREEDREVSTTNNSSTDFDQTLSFGYQATPEVALRTGLIYKVTDYSADDLKDKKNLNLFLGINLAGRVHTFDIEAGYSIGKMYYVPIRVEHPLFDTLVYWAFRTEEAYDILEEDDLTSFYISPRLSHKLGNKTGVSITYSFRKFVTDNDNLLLYGRTEGLVSPWATDWEGSAITLRVKTYLVPGFEISGALGYWDKEFFPVMERHYQLDPFNPGGGPVPSPLTTLHVDPRRDFQRRANLSLKYPMVPKRGFVVEPSLTFAYTSNSSSVDIETLIPQDPITDIYEYNDFSITTGITVRF